MASIAKVVVEISLDREFDYKIPAHLRSSIQVGTQVTVPFHGRELRGFVVGLANHSAFADKLKAIGGVVGEKPLIPDEIMKLAYWIADYYCAPIEQAVRTVLPSAVRRHGARHKKQRFVKIAAAHTVDGASSSVVPAQQDQLGCMTELEAPSTVSAQPGCLTELEAPSTLPAEQGCLTELEAPSTLAPINYFDISEPVANMQGNLPHWRQEGATYFVTFRLGDSMPQDKLKQWTEEKAEWLSRHPEPHSDEEKREYYERFPQRFQNWLDQGMGSCILAQPALKKVVEDALKHFDGDRYRLREYVVMPNHVHLLISPLGDHLLSDILHSLKSFTANEMNKHLAEKLEPVWQHESFDHIVRSPEQAERIRKYIRDNPKNVDGASSSVVPAQPGCMTELEAPSTLPAQPGCMTELEAPSTVSAQPALKGRQKEIFQTLETHGGMTVSELCERVGCSDSPIKTLEKKGLVTISEETIQRDPHAGMELLRTQPFDLMAEQQTALDKICASMDLAKPKTVLLHGVTGSGKTEVYLQALQHALDKGQGAIVLVPEISLTPQTVDRFRSRFGDCVAVLHSNLSDGERHDEWHRIRDGKAQIAIGARSALFAPVENVGLIVVDEEHEPTYKQDESPRYNARDVAVMRGHLENCCVVLGSATPALESFANVKGGRYELAEMLQRVDDRSMPLMRIVDMRIEAEKEGRPTIFSSELVQGIYDRLNLGEQVILFLNRRGFSSSIQCEMCGYT
ncbi:primosomal protein N', partial [Pontiella sp.]|uniref:replication restart helicase PriA n=1 Tax=Pontiella sp. TaxID=2837462 RepID=UPI003566782B